MARDPNGQTVDVIGAPVKVVEDVESEEDEVCGQVEINTSKFANVAIDTMALYRWISRPGTSARTIRDGIGAQGQSLTVDCNLY